MLMMYEISRVVVVSVRAAVVLAVFVNLCHSHSNCSVVIGTRQNVLCGDDEYCKLQAQYSPVSEQWPIVELTCANQCIENNFTLPYSITYTKCCKKTQCQWINQKDQILLDGQRPAESSSLSPTTTTLLTHTTHIGSSSTVTTVTPLHTPDQTKNKFMEAMSEFPVWAVIVINLLSAGLIVFIICFIRYHLKWYKSHKAKARKIKVRKANNRRRFRLKVIRNNQ